MGLREALTLGSDRNDSSRLLVLVLVLVSLLKAGASGAWWVTLNGSATSEALAVDRDGASIIAVDLMTPGEGNQRPITVLKLSSSGKELWRTTITGADFGRPEFVEGWVQSLLLDRSDQIYLSGLLAARSNDPPSLNFLAVAARLEPSTGRVLWQREILAADVGTSNQVPLALGAHGELFLAFVADAAGLLTAQRLSAMTGNTIWSREVGAARRSHVSLAVDPEGNTIVGAHAPDDRGYLVKLDRGDGRAIWRYDHDAYGLGPIAVTTSGDVFIGGNYGASAKITGDTGHLLWRSKLGVLSSLAVTDEGDIVAAGYLGEPGKLRNAITKLAGNDGGEVWRTFLDELTSSFEIATDTQGDVLIAGATGLSKDRATADFFVGKVSGDSGTFLWRRSILGLYRGGATRVALDRHGDAVALGYLAVAKTDCGDDTEVAIAKLDGGTGRFADPARAPTPQPAAKCEDHMLYVTSTAIDTAGGRDAGRLALIDGTTLGLIESIDVGGQPLQMVVAPGEPMLYIVDPTGFGNSSGGHGRVIQFDVARRKVADEVEVGIGSTGIALTPDGSKLYVSNSGSASLSILKTHPLTLVGTIAGIESPRSVAVNPLQSEAYVVTRDGFLWFIDTGSDEVTGTLRVAEGAHSVSVVPWGRSIFVSGASPTYDFVEIDAARREIVRTIPDLTGANSLLGALAFTEDGKIAVKSHDDAVVPCLIEVETGTFSCAACDCRFASCCELTWNAPGSVAVRGDRAYAGNFVVDIESRTVVGQIPRNYLRGNPLGVAVGPCVDAVQENHPSGSGCAVVADDAVAPGQPILMVPPIALWMIGRSRREKRNTAR